MINEVLLTPVKAPLYCTPTPGLPNTTNAPRIELYNASLQTLQLPHAGLDSGPNTTIYNFLLNPMPAHSFIVIFLPANQATEISKNALLRLTTSGTTIDQVSLPVLLPDTSYARTPDGGASWHITQNPTIGVSNVPIQATATATAKTKKPTATPKAHRPRTPTTRTQAQDQAKGDTVSQSADPTQTGDQLQPQGNYMQANWKDVHIPTPENSAGTANSPPTAGPVEVPASNGSIAQKIILSVLILTLICVLWLCRRLFFKS
ncbi:hypothetical protein KDK_47940 [Dictyobacter kobayashii]|uniref:Uncharacterized protein n=1 Tax=Dictyobacter kobayashii TaxID=2014872 RepID=A0A402APL1_9CHLR|nr:hypothetical protein KDK_47940 [Dictyobacter kobayashii]